MRFSRYLAFFLAIASVTGAGLAGAAQSDGFVLIVHPEQDLTAISADEVSKLFLKRLRTWKTGARAIPVDQRPGSLVRTEFSRRVHERGVVFIEVYWKKMIFSGRNVPPPELGSDREVVEFVRSTPGAVGYVSKGADLEGVQELEMQE